MAITDFRTPPGLREPILHQGDLYAETVAKADGAELITGLDRFRVGKDTMVTQWCATADEAWARYCAWAGLETGGDVETALPWKWAICGCCDGHGTDRGASVECDGGGFTASEWADEDDDFKEEYLAGRYDQPCTHCGGGGKVKVPDEDRMTHRQVADWREQQDDNAEIDAIHESERRMGA